MTYLGLAVLGDIVGFHRQSNIYKYACICMHISTIYININAYTLHTYHIIHVVYAYPHINPGNCNGNRWASKHTPATTDAGDGFCHVIRLDRPSNEIQWGPIWAFKTLMTFHYTDSDQIIIFHQPRFPWNKGISLTKPLFGVRLCEVAI